MVVIYAEKPGMARLFAAALGGIDINGKIISFNELSKNESVVNRIQRQSGFLKTNFSNVPYLITWGYGHLCELKDIKDYDPKLTKWQNIPLPFIPNEYSYKIKMSSKQQFEIVKSLFTREDVEYIVNATDDDREGEGIFCYTYEMTGSNKKTYRAILNKQTKEEIVRAFSNLSEKRINIENAARARGIADWQIGISMTIKATLQYGHFGDTYNIGRVMTPTLNLIVEREKQIASFKSNVSYAIKAVFTKKDGTSFEGEYDEKFQTEEAAKKFIENLDINNCTVKSVENKTITENPPFPFSLDTLQKAANETFGMTANDTLAAAQKVYEGYGGGGSLSYPRTDSVYYTEDLKTEIPRYIKGLARLPEFKEYVEAIGEKIEVPNKYFDNKKVDSHAALSVTEVLPPYSTLKTNEKNIYDIVARSVIMLAYPDFKYIRTKVSIDVDGKEFSAKGRKVKEDGWTVLKIKKKKTQAEDSHETPENNEAASALPNLRKGEVIAAKLTIAKTKSQKPSRYTDSTLLSAMKNCGRNVDDKNFAKVLSSIEGIGRPSTRAATIEKLVNTQYVVRQKNHLIPTQKAMKLMERLPVDDLKSPELTARWETELDLIANGKSDYHTFIEEVQNKSREWCGQFYGGKIDLKKNEQGVVEIASSAKKPPKFPTEAYGHKFSEEEKENLQNGDTYHFKELVSKKGRIFEAWVKYKDYELTYYPENPFLYDVAVCPKCRKPLYYGKYGLYCKNKCISIPDSYGGRKLGVQEKYDLLTRAETDVLNGFISKKTNAEFSAKLILDENYKVKYDFSFSEKAAEKEKITRVKPKLSVPESLIGKKYHED